MAIQWDEQRFGTGFPEIDAQHKELFNRLNQLSHTIERKTYTRLEIYQVLLFLEDYVVEHFGCEERLMENHHCKMCPRNKADHKYFLSNLEKLLAIYEKEGVTPAFVDKLKVDLEAWIQNHIAHVDSGLRDVAEPAHSA